MKTIAALRSRVRSSTRCSTKLMRACSTRGAILFLGGGGLERSAGVSLSFVRLQAFLGPGSGGGLAAPGGKRSLSERLWVALARSPDRLETGGVTRGRPIRFAGGGFLSSPGSGGGVDSPLRRRRAGQQIGLGQRLRGVGAIAGQAGDRRRDPRRAAERGHRRGEDAGGRRRAARRARAAPAAAPACDGAGTGALSSARGGRRYAMIVRRDRPRGRRDRGRPGKTGGIVAARTPARAAGAASESRAEPGPPRRPQPRPRAAARPPRRASSPPRPTRWISSRRRSSSGCSVTASRRSSNGLRNVSSSVISFLMSEVALRMSRMTFPSLARHLRQLLGTEEDQGEHQDDDDLAGAEVEHGRNLTPSTPKKQCARAFLRRREQIDLAGRADPVGGDTAARSSSASASSGAPTSATSAAPVAST